MTNPSVRALMLQSVAQTLEGLKFGPNATLKSYQDSPTTFVLKLEGLADEPEPGVVQETVTLFNQIKECVPYLYFELAYYRTTAWACWLIDETNGKKEYLAQGQGLTPEEACLPVLAELKKFEAAAK